MSGLASFFSRLLADPPPELVFEITPDAIRMARPGAPQSIQIEVLPHGSVSPSPLHDNIPLIEPLSEAVVRLAGGSTRGKRRSAALLLPDHSAHISVLDFDKLPDSAEEQAALVRFRLKRSIPFDIDAAALSYWVQGASASSKGRREIVAAVTPRDIVSKYEAPFRAAGIHAGFVSLAPLACLDLAEPGGIVAIARLSGTVLTVLVREGSTLKVARSIEIARQAMPEIAEHLHPTLAYIEDNVGSRAQELLLAGFGELEAEALREFPAEFQLPVSVLGGPDTGIRGYLKGVTA